MNLQELILQLAENALGRPEKYLRPGHNGPYRDPETPVRNLGHWLITFAKCYEWTGERRFRDKVLELAEYLCSEEVRPYGYSFHHRSKPDKDRSNGLIGQAWTFEALTEASAVLRNEGYGALAEEVFFQHPFDYRLGLWRCLEIDGKVLALDATFNHQLWFAACSSLIQSKRSDEIRQMIERFFECIGKNMTVMKNGLIYHPITHLLESRLKRKKGDAGRKQRRFRCLLPFMGSEKRLEEIESHDEGKTEMQRRLVLKSIGYHCFNMYGFAILYGTFPSHSFWRSGTLISMVDYMQTDEYREGLKGNPFGYPYNPSGFEVPFSLNSLKTIPQSEVLKTCSWWVNEQLKHCFDRYDQMMSEHTEDALTLTARIYEATRLPRSLLEGVRLVSH